MKICLISKEYPEETGFGGIGTYVYTLAHGLAKYNHEVHVISSAIEKNRDYMDGKVFVYRIKPKKSFIPYIGRLIDALIYSGQVYNKFKKLSIKFDIIEAPEYGAEAFWISLGRYKLITKLHTPSFLIDKLQNVKTDVSSLLVNFLEEIQTKRSVKVCSPSKSLANIIKKEWNIKTIEVIPYPININRCKRLTNKKGIIKGNYLLYLGRLETRKGVHILAKALPEILEKFKNLKVVFLGKDKSLKNHIIKLNEPYKSRLIFINHIKHAEAFRFIKKAKLIILPSIWENFPNTCLESMALNKVIIGTRHCGFEEIIEDGRSGFLVEPGDVSDLKNTITMALCLNKQNLKIIEQNAKKRAKDFSNKNIIEKVIDYYENIK